MLLTDDPTLILEILFGESSMPDQNETVLPTVKHELVHCSAPECKEKIWIFLEPYSPRMWGWAVKTCSQGGCPLSGKRKYYCHNHRSLAQHDDCPVVSK